MSREEQQAGKLLVWAMRCWAAAFLISCATGTLDGLRVQLCEPFYWLGLLLVFAAGVRLSFGVACRAGVRSVRIPNPALRAGRLQLCTERRSHPPTITILLSSSSRRPAEALQRGRGKEAAGLEQAGGIFVNYRCRVVWPASFATVDAAVPTACPGPTPALQGER